MCQPLLCSSLTPMIHLHAETLLSNVQQPLNDRIKSALLDNYEAVSVSFWEINITLLHFLSFLFLFDVTYPALIEKQVQ